MLKTPASGPSFVLCVLRVCLLERTLFFHADILGRPGSNLVFIVPFGTSYVEFGTEVWLVPFGIMNSKSLLDRSIFRINIPNCEK